MDRRPNCRNKAALSNLDEALSGDNLTVYCVAMENESDVRVINLYRYLICTLYSSCKINEINPVVGSIFRRSLVSEYPGLFTSF